jgi:hypothetical protein
VSCRAQRETGCDALVRLGRRTGEAISSIAARPVEQLQIEMLKRRANRHYALSSRSEIGLKG